MTYYVLCTPCLGDPAKALWYPGSVTWAFVKGRRPPLFAAYSLTARRAAARVVRDAAKGFGAGHVPANPIRPGRYKPERGDVIVSVVCPLATSESPAEHPPLVAVAVFPDTRSVHEMARVVPEFASLRRLELGIAIAVNSVLI